MFEGVEAAHDAGIVHRDLKPDNLMITSDKRGGPLLKILDFGIAKVDEPSEKEKNQNLTRPGSFLGTPEYMAPEQVYSANSADARSDIFSLGVILFEMLAGRRPVLADDPQQIAVAYLTGAFSKLDELRPDLPRPIVDAVHRALAPQPRDRMATVHELRLAVEPFAPARPQATRSGTSTVEPAPVLPPTGPQAVFPTTGPGPRPSAPPNGTVAMPTSSAGARPIPETFGYADTAGPGSALPPTDGSPFAAPPTSVGAARPSLSSLTAPAMMPEFPPVVGPPSFIPEPSLAVHPPPSLSSPNLAPPLSGRIPSAPSLVPWPPPVSAGPPPPPPRKSNMGLIVGLGIVFLLVAGGGTLGALYYLGYLDEDPPAKTHPKPRPKPTVLPPAPHKPSNLK
jgi:serine/threonine-protein kinase